MNIANTVGWNISVRARVSYVLDYGTSLRTVARLTSRFGKSFDLERSWTCPMRIQCAHGGITKKPAISLFSIEFVYSFLSFTGRCAARSVWWREKKTRSSQGCSIKVLSFTVGNPKTASAKIWKYYLTTDKRICWMTKEKYAKER